jgi:ABC-type multidrug transport system fused ATPase/permease subunit
VLFTGTIRENVLVGKPDATEEEVIEALTEANIYEFISQKPEGLDFQIGVGGSKLSGGQKQRVAIARALVKKPHLLILDEATSALDRKTERQIQETIEKIRRNRESKLTIICIAHRLKTIESADRIFFIQEGRVVESGVFEEISYFRSIEPTERALLYESCHRMNKKNSLISERNISLRQTLLRVKVEEP